LTYPRFVDLGRPGPKVGGGSIFSRTASSKGLGNSSDSASSVVMSFGAFPSGFFGGFFFVTRTPL